MVTGVLPGGYWDAAGRQHREFELATLTGREEEVLALGGRPQTAGLVTEVLSRCVRRLGDYSPVPVAVVRDLLVADRHFLMLHLRRAAFGERVLAELVCPWPDCGERVSLSFGLSDVPVEAGAEPGPRHTVEVDGVEVEFRLPTGADQEELSALATHNEAEALTLLLARCVLRLGDVERPGRERLADLSASTRAAIEERMRQVAPRVEQTMAAACAECGRQLLVPFDVQRFFFGQLRADGRLLYQEVHYLAYHYHWSEHEIMAMTRDRRRHYVDVLAERIEVLNGG